MKLEPKNLVIVILSIVIVILIGSIYFIMISRVGTTPTAPTTPGSATLLPVPVVSPSAASNTLPLTPPMQVRSDKYTSTFSFPYPVSWKEGQSQFTITGASIENDQLTIVTKIRVGGTYECIPLNLRLVLNEEGDMERPITQQFQFPDSGGCQGTPNTTYQDQRVVFSTNNVAPPFLVTTGGLSNIYFEVATTTSGVSVKVPLKSG